MFGLAPWYSLPFPEGTYAEFVSAKEDWLASVPSNLPLHEAGQVPLVSLTAWQVPPCCVHISFVLSPAAIKRCSTSCQCSCRIVLITYCLYIVQGLPVYTQTCLLTVQQPQLALARAASTADLVLDLHAGSFGLQMSLSICELHQTGLCSGRRGMSRLA